MLDPTVTGASNPAVFAAAKKARESADARGLTGDARAREVMIATIRAKQGRSYVPPAQVTPATSANITPVTPASITPKSLPSVPGPPATQSSPIVLPLPGISGKPASSGAMSGATSTPPVDFSSDNQSEMSHRSAVKSHLGILEF